MSWKPRVVTSAVRAPFRSSSVLIAIVAPWRKRFPRSNAPPALSRPAPMPRTMWSVVVSALPRRSARCASSKTAMSVKVPPTSAAMRSARDGSGAARPIVFVSLNSILLGVDPVYPTLTPPRAPSRVARPNAPSRAATLGAREQPEETTGNEIDADHRGGGVRACGGNVRRRARADRAQVRRRPAEDLRLLGRDGGVQEGRRGEDEDSRGESLRRGRARRPEGADGSDQGRRDRYLRGRLAGEPAARSRARCLRPAVRLAQVRRLAEVPAGPDRRRAREED